MTISFLYSHTHTRISTSIHSAPMFVGTLSFKPIAKFNASIHFISFPFIFIHIIIESIRMLQHWICSTNIHEIWLKIESLSTCIEMVLPLLSMSIQYSPQVSLLLFHFIDAFVLTFAAHVRRFMRELRWHAMCVCVVHTQAHSLFHSSNLIQAKSSNSFQFTFDCVIEL